jgi:signal peptidase I
MRPAGRPPAREDPRVSVDPEAGGPTAADPAPAEAGQERRRASAWGALRETAVILVSALVLSLLIKTFLAQAFYIPSASMHDTLIEGDRVLVSKLTPGPFDLERGDIVVFKDPGGWLMVPLRQPQSAFGEAVTRTLTFVGLLPQDAGEHLIKRVIGLPGDRVACCDPAGRLTVNGVAVDEPYLRPGSVPSEVPFDVVVAPDSLWVMGDNRQDSQDSRAHLGDPGGGMVPVEDVVGTAFVVLWPLERITLLRDPEASFAGVPDP